MMSTSPTVSGEKRKEVRAGAVASITQDMTSARLKILGDLMENRKKAEAHEQEFLRTIHSENAALSQVISLFESHLLEARDGVLSSIDDMQEQSREHERAFSELKLTIPAEIQSLNAKLGSEISKLYGKMNDTQSLLQTEDSQLKAEILQTTAQLNQESARLENLFNEHFSEHSSRLEELENSQTSQLHELRSVITNLSTSVCDIETQISKMSSIWEEKLSHQREQDRLDTLAILDARFSDLESKWNSIVSERMQAAISQIKADHDSKLNNIQTEFKEYTDVKIESMQEEFSNINTRLVSIETSSPPLPADTPLDTEAVSAIVHEILAAAPNEQVEEVKEGLLNIRAEIDSRFRDQDSHIQSIASTGHYYEWQIQNAKSKLNSLGVLLAPGKFVSSENFSIGPYKNFQLRFYPVSSPISSTPSVWLVHGGSSTLGTPDVSLPVYIDIGIGMTKKCMCKMKKVSELFGHWVWEANGFDRDTLMKELSTGGDLIVSVEVSMRQWMSSLRTSTMTGGVSLVPTVQPVVVRPASTAPIASDDIPDSPMSAYTFYGGGPGVVRAPSPSLILRPASTNPFETLRANEDPPKKDSSSLTPRRKSWAMFGEDENRIVNPFSR